MAAQKFFYGWKIVGVSAIGLASGWAALGVFSFGAFIKPLEAAFGWSRGEISFALMVLNLAGIVMAPLLGFAVDKYGIRRVLLPSSFMLGVLVASLYWLTNNVWHFYAIWFFVAIFGCAASPLSYSKLLVRWFDRRRGLALGLGLAGVGFGAALMPPFAHAMISNYGWRMGYLALGAVVLVVSVPLLIAFIKDSPTEVGTGPDGDPPTSAQAAAALIGFTVRETTQRRHFWLMVPMFFLIGTAITAVIVHLIPLLIERGIDPDEAAKAQGLLGVSLICGRVFAGWLMDRIFAPLVSIAFLIGPIIGLALLASGASGASAYLAVVLVGLAIGAEFDVMSFFISRYSGLLSFGQIYGFLFAAFELGAGTGAVVMGYCFDATGEYTLALWIMTGAVALACVLTALMGPYPQLPEAAESTA